MLNVRFLEEFRKFWPVVFLVIVLCGTGILGHFLVNFASASIPFSSPHKLSVHIAPGDTMIKVSKKLSEAGILVDQRKLVLLSQLLGYSRQIKSGLYEFNEGVTPYQALRKMVKGEVEIIYFTIVEGTTSQELLRKLRATENLRHDSVNYSEKEILAFLGEHQHQSLEGLLFPDTYQLPKNSSDLLLLKMAYDAMKVKIARKWARRDKVETKFLKNSYQALILASIVEKESAQENDKQFIAAVFMNRMRVGMKLQSDPTVIYGLKSKFTGNLQRHHLKQDNPYNTYTRYGLSPTPISFPSDSALEFVLRPIKSPYFYFVARGDGSSHFSKNLAEHQRAVYLYQKRRK